MTNRSLRLLLVVLFSSLILSIGGFAAQNPPAAPKQAPAPKASLEGSVTRVATGQPLREAQITLRKATDAATAALAAARGATAGLPPGVDPEQAGALQDLFGAIGALRGGNGVRGPAQPSGPVEATVVTDRLGHFVVTDIEPGNYIVTAERDGYLRQEYGQRIDTTGGVPVSLEAGKRVTVDFHLVPAGVISGKVFDTDGSPLPDARIQAYTYSYNAGKRALTSLAMVQTNDLGEYRLYPLTSGAYFISVTPKDGLPVDALPGDQQQQPSRTNRDIQTFLNRGDVDPDQAVVLIQAMGLGLTPLYYPGVLDPTEAQPVRVAAAENVQGIDFRLRPVRMVTVKGRVEPPFELPTAAARQAAIEKVVGTLSAGGGGNIVGGAVGRGGANLGGAFIAGLGGNRGGPAGGGAGGLNNPQEFFGTLQNVQSILNPFEVKFARIGAESQNPLAALIGNGATPVDQDGKFEIGNVTPGSYNLTAIARDQKGVEYTARMRVEVGNANLDGLTITPKPGLDIRGQLYAETTPPAFKPEQVRVSLVSDENTNALALLAGALGATVSGGLTANVEKDGGFTLKNVGSLPYRVRVTGLPTGGYVQAAIIAGTDPLNAPFVVDPEKEQLLQVQVGFSAGNVTATVLDASGKVYPGITAALVPDEARRGRSELYFSGPTDASGKVIFANVPPGAYKVFAWEEAPSGAFRYPEYIRAFEDRGTAITVEKNGAGNAEVKAIPREN